MIITKQEKEFNYQFLSYSNFKILGVDYNIRELLDNINIIKSIKNLVDLLKFDEKLRNKNKCFSQKDKNLINQHKLSAHYYKTNDCYFKFNKDLKIIFDNTEWFNVVKDIICGNEKLNNFGCLASNIKDTLQFGEKVYENYDDILSKLSRCKRFYHNKQKSRTYGYNDSSSDSSSDY